MRSIIDKRKKGSFIQQNRFNRKLSPWNTEKSCKENCMYKRTGHIDVKYIKSEFSEVKCKINILKQPIDQKIEDELG